MLSWFLIFTFTLADGRTFEAEQQAVNLYKFQPIRTRAGCLEVAAIRQHRIQFELDASPGLIRRVEIKCEPRRNPTKRRTR